MVPGLRSPVSQGMLWEVPMGGHAVARNVIGDLCERLTARMVGGVRHKTDARFAYCPDVSARGVYYESKAAGRGNQTFVYGGRLDKDREFARQHRLVYVVWRHGARTLECGTVEELERMVLATMKRAYVVPFAVVDAACAVMVPDRLNSAYGGSDERPEYGSGYRLPLRLFDRWVHRTYECGYAEED